MIRYIILIFSVIFFSSFGFSITQFTVNSCAADLDQPYNNGNGIEYILNSDLNTTGTDDCISIIGNDVKLDCQGHTLTGDIYYNGISIFSNNSKVDNCQITNFYNGVYLWGGVNGNIITNVTAYVNTKGAGVGLYENSRNNQIIDLDATGNYFGVSIYDSDSNLFKDNYLNNNKFGVYLASNYLSAENNQFEGGDYRSNTDSNVHFVRLQNKFGSNTKFMSVIFGDSDTIIGEDPNRDTSYRFSEVRFDGNTYYDDDVEELPFCFPTNIEFVCDDDAILPNYNGPELDEIDPSMVVNVIAALIKSDSVSLVWDAATDDVAVWGYRIYRDGSSIGTTTNTYYQNFGLTPEIDYTYQVQAIDTSNNVGIKSAVLSVRTLKGVIQNDTNETEPQVVDPPIDPLVDDDSGSSGGDFIASYDGGSLVNTLIKSERSGSSNVCISNYLYENWSSCVNDRQTRFVKDLNGCARVSIESRICKDGNSDEENLLLNSRKLDLIEFADGRYLVELSAGYNEIFYTTKDFKYSVFIATDKNTNQDYYGERYDYKEEGRYYFTLKRIDESNIDQVYDIAGIQRAITIGNYLTRFLVVVMFITLGVYLYYAFYYKKRRAKKKENKE